MEKSITEAECNLLENTFHQIITNMKMSFPALEDLTGKALKLTAALRTTISATSSFLEAFQKVANLALGSKGSTNEIGSMLIRLCLRQRAIEDKLKQLAGSITEGLVTPLQERLEEWKKAVIILDKDHAKESKRAHQDIKKSLSETVRLKKKSKKPKPETAKQLEHALNEYNEKYEALEVIERNAVRSALVEEHSCFCYFIQCLKPVMDCEVAIMAEMAQVEQLMSGLQTQSLAPFLCPDKSNLAQNVKLQVSDETLKVDGDSPNGSQGSRKSSVSSSSSGCAQSPLHVSIPGSTPLSKDKIPENQDCCSTVTSPSFSHQIVSSQLSWPSCPDHTAGTVPRIPAPSGTSATASLSDEPQTIEHQIVNDSSFARDTAGAHQYAVPCAVGADSAETIACAVTADACTKLNDSVEQQLSVHLKSVDSADDIKKVQVVPLEGYVNMNQLACLAVQQQEMKLKKELMNSGDESDGFDLPPPPPEFPANAAISSGTFEIPTSVNTIKRTTSCIASRTAEDVLLSGEFEVFADSVLEPAYSCSAASNFNSLPRSITSDTLSSMHAPFKYTASQRFLFGSATIRRAPLRDRSLPPPTSRKSSKTTILPLRNDAGQASATIDQGFFSPRCAKDYRKRMEEICEMHMETLPLPPPPVEVRSISAADNGTTDDLPLPPPPEDLKDFGFHPQLIRRAGSSELLGSGGRRHVSAVSSHAGIIRSLNVKFSEQQTLPRAAVAANFARGRRASDAMCIEDVKSTKEPTSPESLTASIQRGIRLRRAVTDDRSAPRLPANQM